jgi:cytoskeletal protein CcmA (bactofilin family)
LQSNAHVTGNIYYQQLRMDCGATVDGKLTRRDAAQAATPLLTSAAGGVCEESEVC